MRNSKPLEERWLWQAGPKTISFALILTCGFMVGLIGLGVLMRYLLKTDLFGVEELVTVVTMWLYFLGATYGSYEESHIKGDMLNLLFKNGRQRKGHQIYVYTYSVIVLAIWAKWGCDYAIRCAGTGQLTPGWHIPLWVSQFTIPVGIFGMLFYSIYHLARNIKKKSSEFIGEGVDTKCP